MVKTKEHNTHMKAERLKQVLRQMIREEVTQQVNKALGKILVEVMRETRKPVITEEVAPEPERPVRSLSTGNEALDSVLAETAKTHTHLPSGDEGVSLVSLMNEGFEKIGQDERAVTTNAPTTKIEFLKQMVAESAPPPQRSVTEGAEVPDMLKKVFKKDFRAVMKAMDRQKKEGNSGLFAGKVQMGG
jgi:hypothetical protein